MFVDGGIRATVTANNAKTTNLLSQIDVYLVPQP